MPFGGEKVQRFVEGLKIAAKTVILQNPATMTDAIRMALILDESNFRVQF